MHSIECLSYELRASAVQSWPELTSLLDSRQPKIFQKIQITILRKSHVYDPLEGTPRPCDDLDQVVPNVAMIAGAPARGFLRTSQHLTLTKYSYHRFCRHDFSWGAFHGRRPPETKETNRLGMAADLHRRPPPPTSSRCCFILLFRNQGVLHSDMFRRAAYRDHRGGEKS